jgi:hypothetical protein
MGLNLYERPPIRRIRGSKNKLGWSCSTAVKKILHVLSAVYSFFISSLNEKRASTHSKYTMGIGSEGCTAPVNPQ